MYTSEIVVSWSQSLAALRVYGGCLASQMTDTSSAAFFTLPVLTKQVCFLFYNNFCLILQDCKYLFKALWLLISNNRADGSLLDHWLEFGTKTATLTFISPRALKAGVFSGSGIQLSLIVNSYPLPQWMWKWPPGFSHFWMGFGIHLYWLKNWECEHSIH